MDRRSFLARLARRGDLEIPRPPARADQPRGDLGDLLLETCAAGGCGVARVRGASAALEAALSLLSREGIGRAGCADLGPELMPLLPEVAAGYGVELVAAADGRAEALALAEPLAAGLTICELAVAQTGGLVQAAGPGGGRILSLLPPLHVALVREADVLPDMAALARALIDQERFPLGPPALALISGPSKTADIEGTMIRGVHGPGRVELILWS